MFSYLNSAFAICGQAYQKKQEFGGAILSIQKSNCSAIIKVDQNSKYIGN